MGRRAALKWRWSSGELDAWTDLGVPELERVVEERYVEHGTGCDGHPVFLLRGVERPDIVPDC